MLGGLIAGAIGGAADAVHGIAEGQIADKRKVDLTQAMAEIESEKALMLDKIKRDRDVEDIGRNASARAAAAPIEAVGTVSASKVLRTGKLDQDKEFGPQEAETAANNKKAGFAAEVSTGAVAAEATRDKAKSDAGKAQRDAEFAEKLAQLSNPKYLKALSAEARAKHVDSAGSIAQANAANFEIGEKKKINVLISELENPATKPERVAAITRSLIARGVMKNGGEFDTEKVTTETAPDGTVMSTKTEATQKRRPGGAATNNNAPAAPRASGPWDKFATPPVAP